MKIIDAYLGEPNPMKTIYVLGLGETLKYYKPDGTITIGVNDIFRHVPVDYLLVMDPVFPGKHKIIEGYNDKRQDIYDVIINSKPTLFLSDENFWKDKVKNFQKINLIATFTSMEGNLITLGNKNALPFSNNSPYTAVAIAFSWFNAERIIMYGVDFNSHIHTRDRKLMDNLLLHYYKLEQQLKLHNNCQLFVYSKESALSTVLPYIYDPDDEVKINSLLQIENEIKNICFKVSLKFI